MTFCIFEKYKNLFGKPGENIHKYRLLDTAIIDYILAIFLAIFLAYLTKIPLVLTTITVFIISIILHMLFCVNTSALRFLQG
jgi:hypothetical protein